MPYGPSLRIYLAAPYWHDKPEMREHRFRRTNEAAARLMQDGHIVFSPISHSHVIADCIPHTTGSHDFWLRQDFPFIEWCDELWVLKLPDWTKSIGIKAEIKQARQQGKKVRFIRG